MSTPLQSARRTGRSAVMGAFLLLLVGCQSFTVSAVAHLRVIDLSPDAVSVDVYQAGEALAYNLSYGTVTSYIPIRSGAFTLSVDLSGSQQVLSVAKGTLTPGGHYTVLLHNPIANLQQVLLTDNLPEQGTAPPSVRLIHRAERAGPFDVYLVPARQRLTSLTPLVTRLAPGVTTAYLSVPAGAYTAVMLPAGTVPSASTIPAHTGTQLSYDNGALRSLILIDAQPTAPHGLQVIATVDADSPN